jgi:hypothetical protein
MIINPTHMLVADEYRKDLERELAQQALQPCHPSLWERLSAFVQTHSANLSSTHKQDTIENTICEPLQSVQVKI